MHFTGDLSKSSKWELLHLKEIPYWHKAGSGIQEAFNRLKASGKKTLHEMDTDTIEVWTSTILALAMQREQEKIFWLGRPKKDPPDMALMTISGKGQFLARELEITKCTHPNEELVSNIIKKDAENNFSEKYILCGFVDIPGTYDLISIGKDLQTKLKKIKNVVLIFNGMGIPHPSETVDVNVLRNLWTAVQISPVFNSVTLDISVEYKVWMNDPDKLRYTKNGKIYGGKQNPSDPYPTLLADTPLSF